MDAESVFIFLEFGDPFLPPVEVKTRKQLLVLNFKNFSVACDVFMDACVVCGYFAEVLNNSDFQ